MLTWLKCSLFPCATDIPSSMLILAVVIDYPSDEIEYGKGQEGGRKAPVGQQSRDPHVPRSADYLLGGNVGCPGQGGLFSQAATISVNRHLCVAQLGRLLSRLAIIFIELKSNENIADISIVKTVVMSRRIERELEKEKDSQVVVDTIAATRMLMYYL